MPADRYSSISASANSVTARAAPSRAALKHLMTSVRPFSSLPGWRREARAAVGTSASSSFTTCEEEMDAIPLEVLTAFQTIVGAVF